MAIGRQIMKISQKYTIYRATPYIHVHWFPLHIKLMLHIKFGFDWPAVLKEKVFEYYGNMHAYCPGVGADEPLVSK